MVGCKWARVLEYNQPCQAEVSRLSCDMRVDLLTPHHLLLAIHHAYDSKTV